MNSVVERARSDSCCKFCDSSVWNEWRKRVNKLETLLFFFIFISFYLKIKRNEIFSKTDGRLILTTVHGGTILSWKTHHRSTKNFTALYIHTHICTYIHTDIHTYLIHTYLHTHTHIRVYCTPIFCLMLFTFVPLYRCDVHLIMWFKVHGKISSLSE